jgi:hypothetical protein
MSKTQFINIDQLSFEPEIQIRVKINKETVAHYASCMETEDDLKKFPPVIVFYDGERYWLADGHHRRAAALAAGHNKVWAIIRNGNVNDAIWEAIVVNGKQGLSLTREDRKRAIEIVVLRWPNKSTRVIAEAIGCGKSTVERIRDQVSQMGHLPETKNDHSGNSNESPDRSIGKDGKSYPAKRKKKPSPPKPEPAQEEIPETAPEELTPDHNGYVPPPLIHQPGGFVPTVTLQHIPQDHPERLIGCVFSLFSEEFILEYIPGLMDRLTRNENGLEKVRTLLAQLNKTYNNKKRS